MGKGLKWKPEELQRFYQHDILETMLGDLGSHCQYTDNLQVSSEMFRELQGMTKNIIYHHPTDIIVPKSDRLYVANGSPMRIAFTAKEVAYGRFEEIDDEINSAYGYKSLTQAIKMMAGSKTSSGVYTILFDAQPKLQRKTDVKRS